MDNATEYLASESTKKLGSIITLLDELRDDFAAVNMEVLAEQMPERITMFHEMLSKLENNLAGVRLISIVMSVCSKESDG